VSPYSLHKIYNLAASLFRLDSASFNVSVVMICSFTLQSVNVNGYRQKVDEVMNKLGRQIQLLFVILPNNNLATYAAVKKRCSIDYGSKRFK